MDGEFSSETEEFSSETERLQALRWLEPIVREAHQGRHLRPFVPLDYPLSPFARDLLAVRGAIRAYLPEKLRDESFARMFERLRVGPPKGSKKEVTRSYAAWEAMANVARAGDATDEADTSATRHLRQSFGLTGTESLKSIKSAIVKRLLDPAIRNAIARLDELQEYREGAHEGSEYLTGVDDEGRSGQKVFVPGKTWTLSAEDEVRVARYLKAKTREALKSDLIDWAENFSGLDTKRDFGKIDVVEVLTRKNGEFRLKEIDDFGDDLLPRCSQQLNLLIERENRTAAAAKIERTRARLSPTQRQIFDLKLQGFSEEQICEALQMARATYQRNWNRARRRPS